VVTITPGDQSSMDMRRSVLTIKTIGKIGCI
jgi:hypothetical protein